MSKIKAERRPVTVRISRSLRDRIRVAARAEGMSLKDWMTRCLERYAAGLADIDPCSFSRTDCALEPEQPCPVCGDLGTFDAKNMNEPSKCIGGIKQ